MEEEKECEKRKARVSFLAVDFLCLFWATSSILQVRKNKVESKSKEKKRFLKMS
jgi:hypothetical protein